MNDQNILTDKLQHYPMPADALEKIFQYQHKFGKKFCPFDDLATIKAKMATLTPAEVDKFVHWKNTFLDCIIDECSEVLNWLPWKHWKAYKDFKLEPIELKFELIDILHFVVSECLLFGIQPQEITDKYFPIRSEQNRLVDTVDYFKVTLVNIDGLHIPIRLEQKTESTRILLRKLITSVGCCYDTFCPGYRKIQLDRSNILDCFRYLFELFALWEMSAEDVYDYYMSKNKENFDRQARGY